MLIIQALLIALLMSVHLVARKLRFLGGIPRSRRLSTTGGISVAYVFPHLFPELDLAQALAAER